jgi:type I restriction enzyme, R subunit
VQINASPTTNFAHLQDHEEQLVRLGMLAERYFPEDPNTCLLKLRQFTELLAQLTASRVSVYSSSDLKHYDLLRRLEDHGILPREVSQLFDEVRRAGNAASHSMAGDHRTALTCIKLSWQLSIWFHRTFKDTNFRSGPFVPPRPPANDTTDLKEDLDRLQSELETYRASSAQAADQLAFAHKKLRTVEDERAFWEQMAVEAEQAKVGLQQHLAELQTEASARSHAEVAQFLTASNQAAQALVMDEADTRKLIDQQLRSAGWTVDSIQINYGKGARPKKGQYLAIAEWPGASGPADYALFVGLMPVGVIEAKRKNIDVSSALQQAKRYSRGFNVEPEQDSPGGPWDKYKIPFVFSTNGRPFLRQLSTRSGVWFCDVRRPDNLSQVLDGWYTPEGLVALLKRDAEAAHKKLAAEPMDYDLKLRPYQQDAVRAIEGGIATGRREMLVAMATGTGKTKTCIALIYRLLKAQRFGRALFLVDRSALGEQAANAFKDTRMENLQTFADIFGIKELDDPSPDTDTSVHIATIQGMVRRILYPAEDIGQPPVDQYDCIVVDECHRGYLLDRELSDTELAFRGFDDYISKYRRVLDYFDGVKIGLTATPALHTTQIFGPPIYTYSYREAVIDGYLVDHEPPVQIRTELSEGGIKWRAGDEVKIYDVRRNTIDLVNTPDEITIEVEDFNRKVITEPFNRVVCEYLALELDPASRQKTLIFCANDAHADLVVKLLKDAFQKEYGSIEDDAVIKITGSADKPLQLIRRFKNERNPNVAVTVDLLTTGIDVPEICNLVFLRRVNSRILFDQMLGRATRLCDDIGKVAFRVFDAVQIYEALKNLTAMQPVVVDPKITFTQLAQELVHVSGDEERQLVRDQFIAKLQRKGQREASVQEFEERRD